MPVNHYKFTDSQTEFLCYSDSEIDFPSDIPVETIALDIKPSSQPNIPIFQFEQLMFRAIHQRTRTPDKILEENNCITFNRLSAAYYLIQNKLLNKSASIRDLITQKYIEILEYE